VLIGTQTFGKGIVQGIFALDDGSAVKMTTAKYYTPKGRNIHGKGLTPDVEVKLSDQVQKLPESGSKVDNQLKAAWDYLQKKIQ
jgi:carboxyl-terminal processing protease